MPNFTPIAGTCIVLPKEPETKTSSGIFLPNNKDQENIGTIVAVNFKDGQLGLFEVGDAVVFRAKKYQPVEFEGKEYLRILVDDIEAVLTADTE